MGPTPRQRRETEPERHRTLSLSLLLKRGVLGAKGQRLGRLADVIVRLRGAEYPLVTGLVADIGGRRIFIPAERVTDWHTEDVQLVTAKVDLREFERRPGEVLLSADILGHRLIDIPQARLVRASDLALAQTDAGWVVAGVNTRPSSLWRQVLDHLRKPSTEDEEESDRSRGRDWKAFEALIGHQPSVLARTPASRLRRLKPPEIADLLEDASQEEQSELLAQVHADPELEADVFEELDDDAQSRLLRDRSDVEAAAVVARMEADDAADAILDLPQDRRRPVLDLLPAAQRTKVTALLSYNRTTAGGLMGLDFLALHTGATVEEALDRVRVSGNLQTEALTTIYSLDDQQRLRGAASLVTLVQADPTSRLEELAEAEPVRVTPTADLITVSLLMTDYDLLTLPVVDESDRILGVITVDDALEATVPDNWRMREPEPRTTQAEDDQVQPEPPQRT
ncbi:magnesium transporter MgtE N-terminal domain-containing protein [Saccharopolyspora sp. NPDC000995]